MMLNKRLVDVENSQFMREIEVDFITAAIFAAISAGAHTAADAFVTSAVADAYQKLKMLVAKTFGENSEIVSAVKELEAKPQSEGKMLSVAEEVAATRALENPEIAQAARSLLALLEGAIDKPHYLQLAIGNNIAQAEGGGNASVSVTGWRPERNSGEEK